MLLGLIEEPFQESGSFGFAAITPLKMLPRQLLVVEPGVGFAAVDQQIIRREVELGGQKSADFSRILRQLLGFRLVAQPAQPTHLHSKTKAIMRAANASHRSHISDVEHKEAPQRRLVDVVGYRGVGATFLRREDFEGHGPL